MPHHGPLKIFSTNAGRELAEGICGNLSIGLGKADVKRHNDGEVSVKLLENVRDQDVFIIAPTHPNAENLLEAVFLCRAARTSSAARVTLVVPYLSYARSDRKDGARTVVAVGVILEMLDSVARPDKYIFLDVHAEQSLVALREGVHEHLYGARVAIDDLAKRVKGRPFVVAAPDTGATSRARKYAQHLDQADVVIFDKVRPKPGMIDEKKIQIIGDVSGKDVIFVDDMIDTGGTIIANAQKAKEAGAKKIFVFATHGLFSNDALTRIKESKIDEVLVTDSIPHDERRLARASGGKVKVLTVAGILAKAVRNTHDGESVSELNL